MLRPEFVLANLPLAGGEVIRPLVGHFGIGVSKLSAARVRNEINYSIK